MRYLTSFVNIVIASILLSLSAEATRDQPYFNNPRLWDFQHPFESTGGKTWTIFTAFCHPEDNCQDYGDLNPYLLEGLDPPATFFISCNWPFCHWPGWLDDAMTGENPEKPATDRGVEEELRKIHETPVNNLAPPKFPERTPSWHKFWGFNDQGQL